MRPDRSTIGGVLSSIYGVVFYTISKGESHWSITYKAVARHGGESIKLIRGFKRRKDAMTFVDNELEFKLLEVPSE